MLIRFQMSLFFVNEKWSPEVSLYLMLSGIVPSTSIQMDIFWKEVDGDSDWVGILLICFRPFNFCSCFHIYLELP